MAPVFAANHTYPQRAHRTDRPVAPKEEGTIWQDVSQFEQVIGIANRGPGVGLYRNGNRLFVNGSETMGALVPHRGRLQAGEGQRIRGRHLRGLVRI